MYTFSHLTARFQKHVGHVHKAQDLPVIGHLTRIVGLKLEAVGFKAPLGSTCYVGNHVNQKVEAEIVGFSGETVYLMTTENTRGITPNAKVWSTGHLTEVPVGKALLGRMLDGSGKPLDGKPAIDAETYYPILGRHINPMARQCIEKPMDVGIKAINALLTVGQGQRIGLMAGSGVGKSVLLSMMTRFTEADVIVVGLIGERGREVKEFIEKTLGPQGTEKAVIVASPADTSPLMRIHGALLATTIAEYFRDQGAKVLLLLDSLTRFAQAQREMSLSIGEPPSTKGYPPSVFAKMSQLIERAGNADHGQGSITAFYTVLAEGDDQFDPVVDSARSILDGHIVLSRSLAERGHYPAIDIEQSISRVMPSVVNEEALLLATELKHIYSHYQKNKDVLALGTYQQGQDKYLDLAVQNIDKINTFLHQGVNEQVTFSACQNTLKEILMTAMASETGAGDETAC